MFKQNAKMTTKKFLPALTRSVRLFAVRPELCVVENQKIHIQYSQYHQHTTCCAFIKMTSPV